MARETVVAGDIDILWRFARGQTADQASALSDPAHYLRSYREPGGAAILARVIDAASKMMQLGPVHSADVAGINDFQPGQDPYWHKYIICELRSRGAGDGKPGSAVWRLTQRLGSDRTSSESANAPQLEVSLDHGTARVVVIEDSGKGFRRLEDAWPKSLANPDAWLLLKSSRLAFGSPGNPLWTRVTDTFKGRMILVVTARDLRLMGMRVSRGLSWERTISDLTYEMRQIWKQTRLCDCAQVVVSFSTAGAVVFRAQENSDPVATLYYDPRHIEDSWSDQFDGSIAGHTFCLTAGIALHLMNSTDEAIRETLAPGIRAGVLASRELPRFGYHGPIHANGLPSELRFPAEQVAGELSKLMTDKVGQTSALAEHVIPELTPNDRDQSQWTMLQDRFMEFGTDRVARTLEAAQDLAIGRHRVGASFADWHKWEWPIAQFGDLVTSDRVEIESLRTISSLMANYIEADAINRPLSVAIFGDPGSGKSFAVEAVKDEIEKRSSKQKIRKLTFNLSQFSKPQAITDALHQVRDAGLSGNMPLVFWDEFDSNCDDIRLGWLRFFLAPIQDGTFQEGPVTHNVGRAIFVFAGGTHKSWASFRQAALSPLSLSPGIEHGARVDGEHGNGASSHAVGAKGPDFLSRLKGYADIQSLNHLDGSDDGFSPAVAFRRAILLRAKLKALASGLVQTIADTETRHKFERLNVDEGIVRAFLRVPEFNYGARSMETILQISEIGSKSVFDRSSLPPKDQLGLHVDAACFLKIVEEAV